MTTLSIFRAVYGNTDLWRPELIEEIADQLPAHWMARQDLLLLIVEVIANAAIHGKAARLTVTARARHTMAVVAFRQEIPLEPQAFHALQVAKDLPVTQAALDLPYGLGFRVMVKLAHRVTLSLDRCAVQIWLRLSPEWASLVFGERDG